jgi:23S rRNA (pseudouridine1915-N3)-methyltransferase
MKIKVISIGKIKEASLIELISEYSKLISKYAAISMVELENSKFTVSSPHDIETVLKQESEFIEQCLEKEKGYIVCLDKNGNELSSEGFSKTIESIGLKNNLIIFIIGGSHGLSQSILSKANAKLSFGKLTFPHKLFRVILLEQIYRAFTIKNNHPYHK